MIIIIGIEMQKKLKKSYIKTIGLAATVAISAIAATALANDTEIKFKQTNFTGNAKKFDAQYTGKEFINAWGIAIRPAGSGGHFWVTAKDKSYQYVGDVQNSPDKKLQKLTTDRLAKIDLPVGGDEAFATGVTFSGSKENFVITQKVEGAEDIKAPAKFIFASDGGVISAWTERKKEDGSFDWPMEAKEVINGQKDGSSFFGITTSSNYDKLYAADFGAEPKIIVYNGKFEKADIKFDQPFDDNKNGKVDAGEYAPFNIQSFKTPEGLNSIFVAYAKTQACPAEEVKAGSCKKGELFVGEEDTSKVGYGRVAEFNENGKLVKILNDGGKLSAPWGLAFAPANWGKFSNALLVANFGDGKILAYDYKTTKFIDYLRDEKGEEIIIDKVWGLLFGNGESLGDKDTLYFAAGPEDETEGLFGSLRTAK